MKLLQNGLTTACVLACMLGSTQLAFGQAGSDYPGRLIRMVCVNAPGGGLDVIGRLVADRLTRNLHQSVIVENRAGAGGNIASEHVAKSAADGYTVLETTNNHNINSFIYKNPGYDPRKDFAAVIQLTEAPSVLVTRAQSPYQTLKEVLNAARAQPGKIAYGNAGAGQPTHIAGEMFKKAANIDLVQIPYKGGGPANQDVIGGQIPLAMSALPAVTPLIQAGTLRALAVTSEKRWPTLPDVPSIAESGYPNFSHLTWIGILAPAGTPAAIVNRLNREIATVLGNPDMRERIVGLGAAPVGNSPADFAAMLKEEYDVTEKLVAQIGLKVD
jgi:tripartite-type tricarboxylate transporter receptor subunit TctC